MRFNSIGLMAVLAVLGTVSTASATVVDTFTLTQNSIAAGSQTTLNLQLTAVSDPGYYYAELATGTVTLSDGLGDNQTFSLSYPGSTATFTATFTYPTSGVVSPSFSVTGATYLEYYNYTYSVPYYYTVPYTYYEPYTYSCGFFSYCTGYHAYTGYNTYVGGYNYYTGTATTASGFSLAGSTDLTVNNPAVAAIPEPSTWAMMLLGFAGIGTLTWRRRKTGLRIAS